MFSQDAAGAGGAGAELRQRDRKPGAETERREGAAGGGAEAEDGPGSDAGQVGGDITRPLSNGEPD